MKPTSPPPMKKKTLKKTETSSEAHLIHQKVKQHWNENASDWVLASRKGYDVWRDHLNTPAFLKMLPNVKKAIGLDIGCGDGFNSRLVAKRCKKLIAIDFSEHLLKAAQQEKNPSNILFQKANAVNLPFNTAQFDFVIATMSFMDIAEIDKVFSETYRVLTYSGFLQFSITHPCFNEHKGSWIVNDQNQSMGFLMKDYFFENQGDVHEWQHKKMPTHHKKFQVPRFSKPLSKWISLLMNAGFYVEALLEPTASKETINQYPELSSTQIVAHSLIFRCKKINTLHPSDMILKKLPGNIWWKDENLIYQGCNDHVLEALGFSSSEAFVGKTDYDLWPKRIADKLALADMKVITTGEVLTLEETIIKQGKDDRVMLTNKSPLRDSKNHIIGLLGTSTDITELKNTEEALRQTKLMMEASKAKAEVEKEMRKMVMVLVGDIVHDLRTPIATIRTAAHFLEKILPQISTVIEEAQTLDAKSVSKLNKKKLAYVINCVPVKSIQTSLIMMDDFINTTLTELTKAQNTILHPEDLVQCSSRRIIENTLEAYPLPSHITITQQITYDFFMMGNSILIMKILFNLLKNAIDQIHLNKKGQIIISTKDEGEVNLLKIKDTAGGASPEVMDKIFCAYFTTKENGTGVGLSFSKKIMQSFGGDLTCHSIYGDYMEFILSFPKIPDFG